MALKDLMDKTAKAASGGIGQGLMGNASEMSPEKAHAEYGKYLMQEETIKIAYQLLRDVFIVTNYRIIDFDKQGATGKKMSIKSIYLDSIVHVDAETAGAGIDDSEITVTYIATPFHKSHSLATDSRKFEFPKKYDFVGLYKYLQQIAYTNYRRLNA